MKKKLFSLVFLALSLGSFAQPKSFDEKAKEYIKQYGQWAIEEQLRVGIPASITLAQGIYETGAGESELATQANNHFGIKCKKEWTGATFAHTDDAPNECFRKYTTAKESYIDHSNYLKNSVRYAELFTYNRSDYSAWAKGLKKCGYATNPAYAQKLIKMIEDYDLQMYTFAAEGKRVNEVVPTTEAPVTVNTAEQGSVARIADLAEENVMGSSDGSVRVNDIKAIYCLKGETLLDKAMKYNMRYARLLEINELPDEPLKRDMYIYLEPKKLKGFHASYIVKEGETIELIAHNEGMTTRQLRIYNLLAQNEQPAVGSILKLQEQSDERPASYKVSKSETAAPAQSIKLINNAAPAKQDEFLPTKKSVQEVEEIEIGYGAERPKDLEEKPEPAKMLQSRQNTPVKSDQLMQQNNVAAEKQNAPSPQPVLKQEEIKTVRPEVHPKPNQTVQVAQKQMADIPTQMAQPVVPSNNSKPKLESEIAAEIDAGDLPKTLEDGAQDELAILKAKLDKAVYARSSKSNMKVSSDDSAAVFANGKTGELPTVKPAATPQAQQGSADEYHTVKTGETAYSIAKKYGIKVKDLNEMNGLNFDGIKVGQKLRIK